MTEIEKLTDEVARLKTSNMNYAIEVTDKERIIAQLTNHLFEYIQFFDNNNVSNAKMKAWLDDEWIPKTRELIIKATP